MYLSDNHNSIEKNLVIILLLNLKVSFQHKFVDQLYCRTWNEISTSQNKQKKRKFFFTILLQEFFKKSEKKQLRQDLLILAKNFRFGILVEVFHTPFFFQPQMKKNRTR